MSAVTGTGFALLVALARASSQPQTELAHELGRALAEIGDPTGEVWLNLLGIPLDAGPPYDVERLLAEIEAIDAVELRLHLLGRHAWSWCALAGIGEIEAAATGDPDAASRLLSHPRYYAGHAADALAMLLPLSGEETRRRILRAIRVALESLLDDTVSERLAAAERAAAAALAEESSLAAVERLTRGYRYVPEPEAERLLLIAHPEGRLPLVLAQHRGARLILYATRPIAGSADRVVALGRALSDPKRIEILSLLAAGVDRSSALVDRTGLSRSTVHHHLAQLREAGLVALEGNARAYSYVVRPEAATEAASLLADVIGELDTHRSEGQ